MEAWINLQFNHLDTLIQIVEIQELPLQLVNVQFLCCTLDARTLTYKRFFFAFFISAYPHSRLFADEANWVHHKIINTNPNSK